MIGQTISHYRIIEKLGEGGMGVVYKAHDTKLDRLVALKFLPHHRSATGQDQERFLHEAKAAATLNHPHVCTIYDIKDEEGKQFIVMEYVDGTTLHDVVKTHRDAPLRIEDAVSYAIQIGEALHEAHSHGIIHRDIKTENIMVNSKNQIKVMDFGLAKLRGSLHLTKTSSTVGTVAYMAPEIIQGGEADARSDIFSFGIVLYEMLAGKKPFRGEHEAAVMYSIMNEDPQSLENVSPPVSSPLVNIIKKALDKDPTKRYQTINELLADLAMVKRGGVPTGTIMSAAARRSKPRWIIAAAIVVFAALGISYFMLSSRPASANTKTIAVLPFKNMSGNPEDEYLSDGMTEDILTQLGKIADLRVISRTTMMQYKGTKKSLRDIAKELNAGVVLEGSVRRAADQMRITAQLIDAGSDEHLWAEMYDEEFTKIFAIQSDVAQKIAAALQAKLSPVEKERIEKKPTANIEAYNAYLKAREYRARNKKQDNETAIDLLKKAITLDSTFALAWAGLGGAYSARYGFGSAISWLDSAIAVSKKAIALDGNSAEAYSALGNCYYYAGKYDAALEGYRKAAELNPNYFSAVANIGATYSSEGRFDEALPWLKKAVALGPTDPIRAYVGYVYMRLGNFDEAERWLMKAIEVQPDYRYASIVLANVYVLQNKDQQANEQMKKVVASNPDDPRVLDDAGTVAENTGNVSLAKEYYERSMKANSSFETDPTTISGIGLGHILLKEGKQNVQGTPYGEARKLLNLARTLQRKQIEKGDASFRPLHHLAAISAIEGSKKEANALLQKAIDAGLMNYYHVQRDPWFENLRNDEQYKQIMAQLKAKLDAMRKRVEEMEKE